jgi:hypothetical protein
MLRDRCDGVERDRIPNCLCTRSPILCERAKARPRSAPRTSKRRSEAPPRKALPATLRYENHVAAATGDLVILHGRFSGHGLPAAWVVADIERMEGDVLAEHWDVIQDEVTRQQSKSGLPMFGDEFPD